jgi:hypothetical protein
VRSEALQWRGKSSATWRKIVGGEWRPTFIGRLGVVAGERGVWHGGWGSRSWWGCPGANDAIAGTGRCSVAVVQSRGDDARVTATQRVDRWVWWVR